MNTQIISVSLLYFFFYIYIYRYIYIFCNSFFVSEYKCSTKKNQCFPSSVRKWFPLHTEFWILFFINIIKQIPLLFCELCCTRSGNGIIFSLFIFGIPCKKKNYYLEKTTSSFLATLNSDIYICHSLFLF